jgi:ferredoxin
MGDKRRRNVLNVPGAWYVDSECISCGLCVGEAPACFKLTDDGATAFVYKQPQGGAELQAAESAMGACPVQAIGNDG